MPKTERKTIAEWQAEGVLRVEDGNHGENRPRKHEFCDEGMAFIRAADMRDGSVIFDDAEKIDEVAQARVRKGLGRPEDILISHKGTVGRVACAPMDAPPFVCSPQTTFWRVLDEDRINRDYLFALMRSYKFQSEFAVRAGETDMAGYVSLTSQRALELELPQIEIQREIGRMIGALDDKIELNRPMSATLEEMARALYRSWFVDFDPVHARAEGRAPAHMDPATAALFPDRFGEDGLPERWTMARLDQVCNHIKRTVKPLDHPGSPFQHFSLPAFDKGDGAEKVLGAEIESNKLDLPDDAILFSRLNPTIPRVWWARVASNSVAPAASTEFFIATAASKVEIPWLYNLFSSTDFRDDAKTRVTGTSNSHQRIPPSSLAEIEVVCPPSEIREAFGSITLSWFRRIQSAADENQTLATLRDTLLPKLMSGELRVRDAEALVGEALVGEVA